MRLDTHAAARIGSEEHCAGSRCGRRVKCKVEHQACFVGRLFFCKVYPPGSRGHMLHGLRMRCTRGPGGIERFGIGLPGLPGVYNLI